MRRRRILATAGTVLSALSAGCLDGLLGSSRSRRQVSLTDVATVGDDHPFRLKAWLRSRAMGPDAAPELELALQSMADEAVFLGYAAFWPEDGLLPERNSDPRGVRLLADSEASELTVEFRACPYSSFRPITEASRGGHRVAAGGEISARYHVVGSAQALADACPDPGQYRLRSAYHYARAPAVERVGFEAADQQQFSWGFAIEVSGNA